MSEFLYPVHSLNANITNFLSKVKSAKIYDAMTSGMVNETNLIDKGSHITEIAYIEQQDDGTNRVSLSSAYCQYFWLVCDVALKILDRRIIAGACMEYHISLLNFKSCVEQTNKMNKKEIEKFLPMYYRIDVDRYLDYLKIVPDLLVDDFWEKMGFELFLAEMLSNNSLQIERDGFCAVDMKSKYSERTNSVYTYGIAFMMLHEMAHHQLKHMYKDEEHTEDEIQADYKAFFEIFSDITGEERFSAICGMMCVFFSFMMLNPRLQSLGVHPREEKRLFSIYDEVVRENPKYTLLLVMLIDFWAKLNHIDDYPKDLPPTEESVTLIRDYFSKH